MVNQSQQVKVADTIYQAYPDGYIAIGRDYQENLDLLANNPALLANKPGVTVNRGSSGSCSSWKANNQPEYISYVRFVDKIAKIRSVPQYTKSEKMSVHYAFSRGRWKEDRAYMSLNITHALRTSDCVPNGVNGSEPFNTIKYKKRRDIRLNNWGNPVMHAQKNLSLTGVHTYSGLSSGYTLTW